ncbi:DNA-binding barrel domain superfamily [Sesbania bispinosa]|nr:DNA-binding barrel domain superfamily [Sesbania bispinosa]
MTVFESWERKRVRELSSSLNSQTTSMTCNRRKKRSVPSAANAIRFFKIITTTSLDAAKLKVLYMQKIPNNFTRKYGGDMSNPTFLKPPDGTEWTINWTKDDGDIWFQKGWKEFATYYSLDYGHMVLFEYKGTSHFEVHVFDKSTLEIQYPFHATQDEQDNDNSVEILEELPPSSCNKRKTKLKSPVSCPQPHKKLRTDTSGDVERSSKLQSMPEHVQIKEDVGATTECLKVEQLVCKITEALNRAATFSSKSPSFMVVMKPSYFHQFYLHVPSQFVGKYLKKKQSDILLQVLEGRTWYASYSFGRIKGGWKKFSSDNNLKVGDVCLFELTKKRPLSFKVVIFSIGEELHSPPPQEDMGVTTECLKVEQLTSEITKAVMGVTNFRSKNPSFMVVMKPAYLRHYMNVPSEFIAKYLKKKPSDILLQVLNRRTWPVRYKFGKITTGWKKFASGNNLKVGDVCLFELTKSLPLSFKVLIFRVGEEIHSSPPQESIQGYGVNWRDLGRIPHIESKTVIVSGGGKATQRTSRLITSPNSFTNGALEEANKFTSQNPFFTVIIEPDFHEDYRPRVPNAFVRNYFNNKQQMVMLQYGNKLWDVKLLCYPYAGSSKFSRGWSLFARESKLLGGDVCVFELIKREDFVLHVHIFRGHF